MPVAGVYFLAKSYIFGKRIRPPPLRSYLFKSPTVDTFVCSSNDLETKYICGQTRWPGDAKYIFIQPMCFCRAKNALSASSSILDFLWNPGFWSVHIFDHHHFVNDFSPLHMKKSKNKKEDYGKTFAREGLQETKSNFSGRS